MPRNLKPARLVVLLGMLFIHPAWSADEPAPDEFLPAITVWATYRGELRSHCLPLQLDAAPGLQRGIPGWSTGADAPGVPAYTVALRTPTAQHQFERDKSLARLDLLTRVGYFEARDTSFSASDGTAQPAREYLATRHGWTQRGHSCVPVGRTEVLEIIDTARVRPDPDGIPAYEVRYRVGLRDRPAWTRDPEARELFDGIGPLPKATEHRLRLVKAKQGWVPEERARRTEGGIDHSRLESGGAMPALPTAEDVLALRGESAFLQSPTVCLRFPHAVPAEADLVEWSLSSPVRIVQRAEHPASNPHDPLRGTWSRRMEGLAAAGVVRARDLPPDPQRGLPAGRQFELIAELRTEIDRKTAGCLRIGPLDVEVLSDGFEVQGTQDGRPSMRFKALGRIPADAWPRRHDWSQMPEIQAWLRHGVPISGLIEHVDGHWKPVFIDAIRSAPVALPKPLVQVAGIDPRAAAPANSAVHVVSLYKGKQSNGKDETEVRIVVGRGSGPLTLVLSAYDAVHWRIEADRGAEIAKVVVMGYHPGRVSGVPATRVSAVPGFLQGWESNTALRARDVARVEAAVGRRPTSFFGVYEEEWVSLDSTHARPPSGPRPPVKPAATPPAVPAAYIRLPAGVPLTISDRPPEEIAPRPVP